MGNKKWKSSPWTIGIGTAIFSFSLTLLNDLFKEKPILSSIWQIIKWVGNLIWKILNFDIKVWWIILFIIGIILLIYIIDKFQKEELPKSNSNDYKEDWIKGLKWSWDWEFSNSRNSWILSDLTAHCPKCDTPMIEQSMSIGTYFDCPRCNYKEHNRPGDESYKVQKIIIDNINRRKNKNNP
jgi:hypothetical protein